MMFCGNPANIIFGISLTFASPWSPSPISVKIEPLKIVNTVTTDSIVVAPAQEAVLVTVKDPVIMIARHLLAITKARTITLMIATMMAIVLLAQCLYHKTHVIKITAILILKL